MCIRDRPSILPLAIDRPSVQRDGYPAILDDGRAGRRRLRLVVPRHLGDVSLQLPVGVVAVWQGEVERVLLGYEGSRTIPTTVVRVIGAAVVLTPIVLPYAGRVGDEVVVWRGWFTHPKESCLDRVVSVSYTHLTLPTKR